MFPVWTQSQIFFCHLSEPVLMDQFQQEYVCVYVRVHARAHAQVMDPNAPDDLVSDALI